MQKLIEGHRHFLAEVFPARREQFHLLSESQAPEFLFITCADSRVVPDLILGTEPGDLFITRNAGNVVPVEAPEGDGVTATIEYAVEVLKVRHAILCGHSDCGALKAAVDHVALESLPKANQWLRHVEEAFDHVQPLNPADGEGAELFRLEFLGFLLRLLLQRLDLALHDLLREDRSRLAHQVGKDPGILAAARTDAACSKSGARSPRQFCGGRISQSGERLSLVLMRTSLRFRRPHLRADWLRRG